MAGRVRKFEVTGAYYGPCTGRSLPEALGREGVGKLKEGLELYCLYWWEKEGVSDQVYRDFVTHQP